MKVKISARADYEDGQRWTAPRLRRRLNTPIDRWVFRIIEGPGGLNDFEYYEMAIANCSDRAAAAMWAIRILGNDLGDETENVVQSIIERRAELRASQGAQP